MLFVVSLERSLLEEIVDVVSSLNDGMSRQYGGVPARSGIGVRQGFGRVASPAR